MERIKVDMSAESRMIYQQLQQEHAQTVRNMGFFQQLRIETQQALNPLLAANEIFKKQRSARDRLLRLKRSINFTGSVKSEEFLEKYNQALQQGQIKSRTLTSVAAVQQTINDLSEQKTDGLIKNQLIMGYKHIMKVRNLYKSPIVYGTSILTKDMAGNDQILFKIESDIDALCQNAVVRQGGGLMLDACVGDLKNMIHDFDSTNKYKNLLDNSEISAIWQHLKQIKDVLKKSSISYNYGNLIEALVYLSKQNHFDANVVYEALLQGGNTTSFEQSGDFSMYEDTLRTEIDIQSKLFNTFGPDNAQRHIRLMSISGVIRVLTQILQTIDLNQNPTTINQNLKQIFEKHAPSSSTVPTEKIKAVLENGAEHIVNSLVNLRR